MLKTQKREWVNWKLEPVRGVLTKVPYQPNGNKAASNRESTWSTYAEVKEKEHLFNGIGIVFNGTKVGIDLDHVIENGALVDKASRDLVDASNTYTEISPSGTGLHVIFNLSEPFSPISKSYKPNAKYKYECYTEKRFFTVTENIFEGRDTVRTVDAVTIVEILSIIGYPWKKEVKQTPTTLEVVGLQEDKILDTMFRASNGINAKKLWEGDSSLYNNDESAADMAFCNLLAFYSGKRADVIERLWLASPRGNREKTRTRKDYRDRTIAAAIAYTENVFTADRSHDDAVEYITKKTKNGNQILLCTENIQTFLNSSPQFAGRFRFDLFKQKIEFKKLDVWQDLQDADILYVQSIVSRVHPAFGMVSRTMVEDAVYSNAYSHSFDSVEEYISALVWDGVPRLDSWLSKAYAVPDDAYHRAVGSNWLKGMVHRAMVPGCKFDYVLVLEGPQGSKKSMSLSALASPWHVETTQTPDNKDFFMLFLGHLVVEFAEGETISRAETKKLKAIITMQEDVLRLPYAHTISTIKRRCVFAMTTNEEHYLKDDTGNRRWLPVTVGPKIDIEWIKQNREQLFAEAHYRVSVLKETTWEFPKEETEAAQAERRLVDPRAEEIEDWYISLSEEQRNMGITTKMAFDAISNKNTTVILREQKMNRLDEMQIASILKTTLHLKKKRVMINGINKNRYFPSEKTPAAVSLEQQFENAFF